MRVSGEKPVDQGRQDVYHHRARHIQLETSTDSVLRACRIIQRCAGLRHDRLKPFSKRLTRLREPHTACRADQKRHSEPRFQPRDRFADRRREIHPATAPPCGIPALWRRQETLTARPRTGMGNCSAWRSSYSPQSRSSRRSRSAILIGKGEPDEQPIPCSSRRPFHLPWHLDLGQSDGAMARCSLPVRMCSASLKTLTRPAPFRARPWAWHRSYRYERYVRDQLRWLEDMGAVTLTEAGTVLIAELTRSSMTFWNVSRSSLR
jgi:hypothetical protein